MIEHYSVWFSCSSPLNLKSNKNAFQFPVGCKPSAAVAVGGDVCVCLGVSAQGVSSRGGWCPGSATTPCPVHAGTHPEFLTLTCENITFPQLLLGMVKMQRSSKGITLLHNDRWRSNFIHSPTAPGTSMFSLKVFELKYFYRPPTKSFTVMSVCLYTGEGNHYP